MLELHFTGFHVQPPCYLNCQFCSSMQLAHACVRSSVQPPYLHLFRFCICLMSEYMDFEKETEPFAWEKTSEVRSFSCPQGIVGYIILLILGKKHLNNETSDTTVHLKIHKQGSESLWKILAISQYPRLSSCRWFGSFEYLYAMECPVKFLWTERYMTGGKVWTCIPHRLTSSWILNKPACWLCSVPDMGRLLIHHLYFLLIISMLACQCPAVSGLFEWLRQTEAPPVAASSPPVAVAPAHLAKDAQFEMATADEKFLAEAKQMELSPLDSCHYRVNTTSRF